MQRAALFAPILSRDGAQRGDEKNETKHGPLLTSASSIRKQTVFHVFGLDKQMEKKSWCHV